MHIHNTAIKKFITQLIKPLRKRHKFTKEKMAEAMRMACRSYGAIERGETGVSAATLLFLLSLMIDEEILNVIQDFRQRILHIETVSV